MSLWRIVREAYQAMDGEGARLNGGRWNSEGLPAVYLSSTLSLAALEYLVHLDIEDAPSDLVALEVRVPPGIGASHVLLPELPAEWNQVPDHPECIRRGDAWLRERRKALLRVPSAVVPVETNVLLNPLHADAGRMQVVYTQPYQSWSPSARFSFCPMMVGGSASRDRAEYGTMYPLHGSTGNHGVVPRTDCFVGSSG